MPSGRNPSQAELGQPQPPRTRTEVNSCPRMRNLVHIATPTSGAVELPKLVQKPHQAQPRQHLSLLLRLNGLLCLDLWTSMRPFHVMQSSELDLRVLARERRPSLALRLPPGHQLQVVQLQCLSRQGQNGFLMSQKRLQAGHHQQGLLPTCHQARRKPRSGLVVRLDDGLQKGLRRVGECG